MTAIPAAAYFNGAITNQNAKDAQDQILAVLREMIGGDARQDLTISAGGAVTPTKASFRVDTAGAASTDDLDTIDQTNHPAGRWIMLRSTDAARTVVVRHNQGGAGKILLVDSANLSLTSPSQFLILERIGTTWEEVLRGYGTNAAAARSFLGVAGLTDANTFTKTQTWKDGGDVATTGSSLTLGDGNLFKLTGTSAVPGFATKGVGTVLIIEHGAAHQLTHHSTTFVLLTGANITTAAGDFSIWKEYASGWKMVAYHKANGRALVEASATGVEAGTIAPYAGFVLPSGYLWCDGAAVSRSTYSALYGALCPAIGTFTITIASPGVFTLTGHNIRTGMRVRLETTGALPTGLNTSTDYYVNRIDANTGTLAATPGGAGITTSGSQSGTHTMRAFPHGAGDGSTTFNVPDARGRALIGGDAMGGTAAGRITSAGAGIYGEALGASGGVQTHPLTSAEGPVHSHNITVKSSGTPGANRPPALEQASSTTTYATENAGSGTAHQNTQPSLVVNAIIKT